MNELWIIRHGRAGVDGEYDCLTPQGFAQAKALGDYLRQMNIRFDAAFSGSLRRQQETLSTILEGLTESPTDQIDVRPALDEFSPRQVVRVAAMLRETNAAFRVLYDEWQNDWSAAVESGKPQFFKVMRHFFEYWAFEPGEHGFQSWAGSVLDGFASLPRHGRLLVVSSATPIALAAGAAFGMDAVGSLKLLQPIYNTSLTIVRRSSDGFQSEHLEPVMFNAVPHLRDPALITSL